MRHINSKGKVVCDVCKETVLEFETGYDNYESKWIVEMESNGWMPIDSKVHLFAGLDVCPKCKKKIIKSFLDWFAPYLELIRETNEVGAFSTATEFVNYLVRIAFSDNDISNSNSSKPETSKAAS